MKIFICFIILMFGVAQPHLAGECDLAAFYLELGCIAIPSADNSTKCPEAFMCPGLHPDPTRCYFKGVAYGHGAKIPKSLVNKPCSLSCICQVIPQPHFTCADVHCAEYFYFDQECLLTHTLGACCSTGTICGEDDIARLKTCEVDGKTYKAGQIFLPQNTHKRCICADQWNGSVDNPAYCEDINCGIEIHNRQRLLDKCAPVFFENIRGCPIDFQCPAEETKVIRNKNNRNNVGSQCVFGNITLEVGDEVTTDQTGTKCFCVVPPFVSCILTY